MNKWNCHYNIFIVNTVYYYNFIIITSVDDSLVLHM